VFLFEGVTEITVFCWFILLVSLAFLNEIARRSMWASIGLFIILPIFLTLFIWPITIVEDSSVGSWFHLVKVYSALFLSVGFMAMKYIKGFIDIKFVRIFPAFILSINIIEAVVRELQVSSFAGINDGMYMLGGPWNYLNAIAGIFNMLIICGWVGIYISKKHKDLIWPDMLWLYIIGYNCWNFSFIYNTIPQHAFYCIALALASIIPAFTWGKGAWLQHRAYTVSLYLMFIMTFPNLVDVDFVVNSSYNPAVMWTLSILSFAVNASIFVYQLRRIINRRLNPFKDEIFTDFIAYKQVSKE